MYTISHTIKAIGIAVVLLLAITTQVLAQGLSFPDVQTNQKVKIGFEETGIEFKGWSNISGYNDGVFLPYLNKYQNYSGQFYQTQAREIYLKVTVGSQSPITAAMNALENSSWKKQADALIALGHLGSDAKDALPSILPYLDSNTREVRLNALWAMMNIDPQNPDVISAAIRFFDERLEDHPRLAFWALSLTGDNSDEVMDLVALKTIKFANLIIQDALVFLGNSDYAPTGLLHENLVHFDLRHRYNSILMVAGLPEIDRAQYIAELILLVNDFNPSIRVAAAYTLGLIGRPAQRAASALQIAASTSEGQALEISTWALRRVQASD